jgi:Uma2 family endonuclease
MDYMREKIDDYLHFGVPYVWIVNPPLDKGYVVTKAAMVEANSGILETSDPEIRVPLAELCDAD